MTDLEYFKQEMRPYSEKLRVLKQQMKDLVAEAEGLIREGKTPENKTAEVQKIKSDFCKEIVDFRERLLLNVSDPAIIKFLDAPSFVEAYKRSRLPMLSKETLETREKIRNTKDFNLKFIKYINTQFIKPKLSSLQFSGVKLNNENEALIDNWVSQTILHEVLKNPSEEIMSNFSLSLNENKTPITFDVSLSLKDLDDIMASELPSSPEDREKVDKDKEKISEKDEQLDSIIKSNKQSNITPFPRAYKDHLEKEETSLQESELDFKVSELESEEHSYEDNESFDEIQMERQKELKELLASGFYNYDDDDEDLSKVENDGETYLEM